MMGILLYWKNTQHDIDSHGEMGQLFWTSYKTLGHLSPRYILKPSKDDSNVFYHWINYIVPAMTTLHVVFDN